MSGNLAAIFSELASTYETTNRVMTFGLDVFWRRVCVKAAFEGGGTRFLDVCSGTGETAISLNKIGGGDVSVTAVDFSPEMIAIAREKTEAAGISFVLAKAKALPFPDESFDAVTVTFALRNLNTSRSALIGRFAEIRRVLRPGGRFIALETSQPPVRLIRSLMHLYVSATVKPVGRILSGTTAGYTYLSNSIRRFYRAEELATILCEAGFSHVEFRRMTFGAVAMHIADK